MGKKKTKRPRKTRNKKAEHPLQEDADTLILHQMQREQHQDVQSISDALTANYKEQTSEEAQKARQKNYEEYQKSQQKDRSNS